jgi:hypothetical protein
MRRVPNDQTLYRQYAGRRYLPPVRAMLFGNRIARNIQSRAGRINEGTSMYEKPHKSCSGSQGTARWRSKGT